MDIEKKLAKPFILAGLVVILLFVLSSRISFDKYGPDGPETEISDDGGEAASATDISDEEASGDQGEIKADSSSKAETMELPDVSIYDWQLQLVNSSSMLTSSFAPSVTDVGDGSYFDSRAADALLEMLNGAITAGYSVYVPVGYRSYSSQASLFYAEASSLADSEGIDYEQAEEEARSYVDYPGTSDHQTGLGADIIDSPDTELNAETAGQLPLIQWLCKHCAEYGFVQRYPSDKADITGHNEPWHFRYVGVESAEYMQENDLCLEEYVDLF